MNLSQDDVLELWEELGNVPFKETKKGTLVLSVPYYIWKKGTEREEIWHWFDHHYNKGVVSLLYGD